MPTNKRVGKYLWYSPRLKDYIAIKKNEVDLYALIWEDTQNILLNENIELQILLLQNPFA